MRIDYYEYIGSAKWKAKADMAKQRANYRCQLCNASGELHAHHREYKCLGNEQPEDIIVLCSACHARFHDRLASADEEYSARDYQWLFAHWNIPQGVRYGRDQWQLYELGKRMLRKNSDLHNDYGWYDRGVKVLIDWLGI